MNQVYDSLVIGGGPAGLSAALAVHQSSGTVLIVEREARLGGILKQCIHDGFGLIQLKKQLTGPEYAEHYISQLALTPIEVHVKTYVSSIEKDGPYFKAILVNREEGLHTVYAKTVILATGCRERTSKQIYTGGTRPSGVYTAGTAQYLVNIDGLLPCKRCVILGSGDIGLIMARRLALEGSTVLGVYEVKSEPSGLKRNIQQCLVDFDIPLYLSHTVVAVEGDERVEAVIIAKVDDDGNPIEASKTRVACDGLILSVGLIPENEIAEMLGVALDSRTGGPVVNTAQETSVPGVFVCGNALKVYDLVDHVSESGEIAGNSAVRYIRGE